VVASMVRNRFSHGEDPWDRLGFLVQPAIANVMFSRAKLLLVIVGSFEHFRDCAGTFWPDLCQETRNRGVVIKCADLLGGE